MKEKLLESVKNKSYFTKAVEWYCDRYLFCVAEKTWLALIASFLVACLCLLLLNIYLLFPIQKDLNFVKHINHTEDEFSVIHKLGFKNKEDEYTSIARYLISKYVEIYESSGVMEQEYQENFIRNNSIQKIHQGFLEKIDSESPLSRKKITNINVTGLFIDRSVKNLVTFFSGNATVNFTVEQNKTTKDHSAEISFTLSNIQPELRIPFKFIVNSYKLR
ncbi:MAG: hypothetical protein PG981_000220 [Wolbachia endosymbiont of Ctenocephalides orientis wCori]|nr:MAG: hypothetical protein PG981_000220 [Wolbachia endosymbiont of Ctenocephalides orientis wCori]